MSLNPAPMPEKDAAMKNPLALAFIGDTVWDLLIRCGLLHSSCRANALHRTAVSQVNAGAQRLMADAIEPLLSEKEADVFRRGSNAHAHHLPPKNQNPYDYSRATGLEAVLGYLYLSGREDRILELFNAIKPEWFNQGGI